ncbi:ribosome silencing factor [Hydrogenophaga sp.]|uniref:ribosome silencing factor n=1 Tax=Hydrogenophaga sp. TaxID=1904254 RepID=UPI00261C4D0C|nr:ribosome silencing factor [Hydrogenophaga sp.]MCW5652341.1 ribosome silencing factor [Hydrogenophaga sp.]
MTSESTAKKDIQKLQRAIVDGLEDVKGQDIVVFNTEHLSPLFERVIVASGTSNRQTKALAASVRDAVRDAGFEKPRIEGEDNGEWIIVDCGAAVAHVMQPVIRQYYRLEEIWGAKPVRLKHGTEKDKAAVTGKPAAKARKARKAPAESAAPVPAKTVVRKQAKSTAAPAPRKAAAKPAARKTVAAKGARDKAPAAKTALKTVVVKPRAAGKPVAKAAAKPAARKTTKTTASRKA